MHSGKLQSTYVSVFMKFIEVNAIGIVESSVDFNNTNDFGASTMQELEGVGSDISEALNNDCLASNAWLIHTAGLADLLRLNEVLNTVEKTLQV